MSKSGTGLREIPFLRRVVLTGLLCAVLVACTIGSQPPTQTASLRPAAIYQRNCSACHGEKGDGQSLARTALVSPPRDFTTDDAQRQLTREYMMAILRDGRPHTAMVGRKTQLSQDQVEAVVDFIRAAFIPPEPGSPKARGREIYRSSCAACHADRGQGRPPAPPISPARGGSDLTRDAMIAAIVRERHAAGIDGFARKLTALDVQAVADYVQSTFIDSVRAGTPAVPGYGTGSKAH